MNGAPRICFVTCARWPEISASDALVQAALERRHAMVEPRGWNIAGASIDGFDLIVFRSNWDYHFERERFGGWLTDLGALGTPVWNPPSLVRWNLDKRYLIHLERAGLEVVPTRLLAAGPEGELPHLVREVGGTRAVLKPAVSASAYNTHLVTSADAPGMVAALEGTVDRRDWLVQAFVEEIQSAGEWSLVFIDGAFTHAAIKRPAADDFRVQARFGGTTAPAVPPANTLARAYRVLEALPMAPLYARIDGVDTADGFLLMEVEVHEPGLFFPMAPEAAELLAAAILRRIS
jgi:glutathione synthase/RimK-type ligase-like ATP-grasp enzyme